jgi:dTDP-4-amino-4,6-dideoxygalactose transaminase
MLATTSSDIYNYVSDLKDYDHKQAYKLRYNYKMSDFQAVLGLSQLAKLDSFISRRQKVAGMYNKAFRDLEVILPYPAKDRTHTYFRYVIRSKYSADWLIQRLQKAGVEAKKAVFRPIHQYLGLRKSDFPVTEEVYRSAVSLPIYPSLKEEQAKTIISKVRKILKP